MEDIIRLIRCLISYEVVILEDSEHPSHGEPQHSRNSILYTVGCR